jgi:glutaredoxin
MTKAWLSSHGVEFDALDVANDPRARAELEGLGFRSVPVVVVGNEHLQGWNPTRLAALVGQQHEERTASPEELVSTLRLVLDAALRATAEVPADRWPTPVVAGRARPLRELVRHLFEVVERGVDADVLGCFPAREWLPARDVPTLGDGAALVRYGRTVQAKFDAWYAAPAAATFGRMIDADVGPRTLSQVLERTRLHAAQHLRQVYALLGQYGVTPERPLTDADLQRLGFDQLPAEVF